MITLFCIDWHFYQVRFIYYTISISIITMSEKVFVPRIQIQRFQNTVPEQVRLGIYNIKHDGISEFIDLLKKYNHDNDSTNNRETKSKINKDNKIKEKEKNEQLRQEAIISYEKRKNKISKTFGDPHFTLFIAHIPIEATEEDIEFGIKRKIPHLTKCKICLIKRINTTSIDKNDDNKRKTKLNYAFVTLGNKNECRQVLSMGRHIQVCGRNVIVEIERGRVVKNWLPKRLRKY